MNESQRLQFQAYNCLAWILDNQIVTENGVPVEIYNHHFLVKPFMDNYPQVVVRKCAQVGWSTLAILRSFHLARFWLANIIYVLPTRNAAKEFVVPKVDPIINQNPTIKEMITETNAVSLKKIGDRFIYYRGSWAEAEAISTSADIILADEFDRCNPKILQTYESRLKASPMKWYHAFSNPSIEDFGVDSLWKESNQYHWFIKCSRCNTYQYLDWPASINVDGGFFWCQKCHQRLRAQDRRVGEWVMKYQGKEWAGYWINHLMAPWITAAEIIKDSKKDVQYFHNFVLGKAYTAEDMHLGRSEIIRALVPGTPPAGTNAMGVDVGVTKHYVIGNEHGIFKVGATDSWEEIERLIVQHNAYTVIDANPYPTRPKQLAKKYRNKVFMCYYGRDRKSAQTIRWGDKQDKPVVFVDRTKIFDQLVAEVQAQEILFAMTDRELEPYINHWESMYRVIKTDAAGIERGFWETKEGASDHWAHATVFWRVALEKVTDRGGFWGAAKRTIKRGLSLADDIIDIEAIARESGRLGDRDWKYT